jgi:glycine cleavage system aminomethyltransferase T
MDTIAAEQLKKTAFFDKHLSFGAKMVPFAGYNMPVQYSGVNDEHINVRQMWEFLMFLTWESLF